MTDESNIFLDLGRSKKRRKVSARRIFVPDDDDEEENSGRFMSSNNESFEMMYDDNELLGIESVCSRGSSGGDEGENRKPSKTSKRSISEPKLHKLLSLNPRIERDRQKFDNDAVLKEVQRDPVAASTLCHRLNFGSYYPLHIAIALGANSDVVEALCKASPQAVREKCRFTTGELLPLHLACEFRSSLSVVSVLIEKFPDALQKKRCNGQTPLHTACKHKAPYEVVSLLLDKIPENAEPATTRKKYLDMDGDTPLHIVCSNKTPSNIISLLVNRFPYLIKQKNKFGDTPLHHACRYHAPHEVISLLLNKNPGTLFEKDAKGSTPVHVALAHHASVQLMSQLLSKQQYTRVLYEKDNFGNLPLHSACLDRALFHVLSLVLGKYPKAIMEQNNYGETPLQITQRKESVYSKNAKLLALVRSLLTTKELNGEVAERHIQAFFRAKWWSGIPLVLDVYPSTKVVLNMNREDLLPYLLSIIGHRCKLLTMWKVLRNKQEIFGSSL